MTRLEKKLYRVIEMEDRNMNTFEKSTQLKEKEDEKLIQQCPEIRKKIAVIFGGCSPEYSVSLQSAYAVICHMDSLKYIPVLIGISKSGDWFLYNGNIEKIPNDTWCNETDCTPVAVSQNRSAHNLLVMKNGSVKEIAIDAAFPVLHGCNGEDGTVQGVFELAGIPLIGCGVLSSALCMDKDRAHKLVHSEGILVPESFTIDKTVAEEIILQKVDKLGYPVFVKPIKAGSSYGISKVSKRGDLLTALALAFEYDNQVIIEECISGFEVGCAVLGNDILTIGEVDEIELADGFFDFTEKYTLKTSAIHVPARVENNIAERIKKTAKVIYKALDCRGFARVDMFLSDSGQIIFNEVNTIPGFTTHSRYPNMMKAAGYSFEQIISAVIERAVI